MTFMNPAGFLKCLSKAARARGARELYCILISASRWDCDEFGLCIHFVDTADAPHE